VAIGPASPDSVDFNPFDFKSFDFNSLVPALFWPFWPSLRTFVLRADGITTLKGLIHLVVSEILGLVHHSINNVQVITVLPLFEFVMDIS
jgi:hypothetical protein